MTKVDMEPSAQTPTQAAFRSAVGLLPVPCRPEDGRAPQQFCGLYRSSRDAVIKDYQHRVVAVEVHPDFASRISSLPLLWAAIEKQQPGDYQPVSPTV